MIKGGYTEKGRKSSFPISMLIVPFRTFQIGEPWMKWLCRSTYMTVQSITDEKYNMEFVISTATLIFHFRRRRWLPGYFGSYIYRYNINSDHVFTLVPDPFRLSILCNGIWILLDIYIDLFWNIFIDVFLFIYRLNYDFLTRRLSLCYSLLILTSTQYDWDWKCRFHGGSRRGLL